MLPVADTWIGGPQPGIRGSRQLKGRKAALVLVAVERRERITGRVRMAVIRDSRAATYKAFLAAHVAPCATLYTDGLTSFGLEAIAGYRHAPKTQPSRTALRGASRRPSRWPTAPSATSSNG